MVRFTNLVKIAGRDYLCALATPTWNYQYYPYGRLAVTTSGEFIWLDFYRPPKLIPEGYQVSRWQTGY